MFPEWSNMRAVFQRTKINKIVVRVMPLQNVANNSTSTVPCYVVFPWHNNDVPAKTSFNSMLSVDKHKVRRQTQGVSQSYVPSVQLNTYNVQAGGSNGTVAWKPTLQHDWSGVEQIRIYGGIIGFQGDDSMEGRKTHFNIFTDVYVEMQEQESISSL